MTTPAAPRIAISGASGRMGRMLIEAVLADPQTRLGAALDIASSPMIGKDAGEFMGQTTGIVITADAAQALQHCDVLIDFTRPDATLAYLAMCQPHGVRPVIGTTGFTAQGLSAIERLSATVPTVLAPNMSVGVNITLKLLEVAGRYLAEGFDIEVI